jgi:hypothetical protein
VSTFCRHIDPVPVSEGFATAYRGCSPHEERRRWPRCELELGPYLVEDRLKAVGKGNGILVQSAEQIHRLRAAEFPELELLIRKHAKPQADAGKPRRRKLERCSAPRSRGSP